MSGLLLTRHGRLKRCKQLTSLQGMWRKSKPGEYNNFRTFIFGITKQSMFPHGVVYEGVSEEPLSFRGESGANDSMVSDSLSRLRVSGSCLTSAYLHDATLIFHLWYAHRASFLEWTIRDCVFDLCPILRRLTHTRSRSVTIFWRSICQILHLQTFSKTSDPTDQATTESSLNG